MEKLSESYYQNIIYENLYLHFFNREIYRGVYGEQIEEMKLDHSDILTTIMLCGCNNLYGAYSAFHETIHMLNDKGELYQELRNDGIITVTGEFLNQEMILEHKRKIYFHDKEKYPGYFDKKEISRLESVIPVVPKPDATDSLEALFLGEKWEEILKFALSPKDANIIDANRNTVLDKIRTRENKAITKSIFEVDSIPPLADSMSRTLTAIYVDGYMDFLQGDIVTGIDSLAEYDKLSKHFPSHDYQVLRKLLSLVGFPKPFKKKQLERILKHRGSNEHYQFALKLQKLLYLVYDMRGYSGIKLSMVQERVRFLPTICANLSGLPVKEIDLEAHNFFSQSIENVECAIETILAKSDRESKAQEKPAKSKKVFVVTGRNENLRLSIYNLLRALKLEPMEWMEAVRSTEQTSAHLYEVIKKGMDIAQAVIVIMAAEEETTLLKAFQLDPVDEKTCLQSRPNVIFETGLAFGLKEKRTIILQFGESQIFSDLRGMHILKYRGKKQEMEFKNDLLSKLQTAGCSCDAGRDYYKINIDYN